MSPDQFPALYQEHRGRLFRRMMILTRDHETAEDVTASTFGIAFEKLHSFRGESSFYTWLNAIAVNEIRRCRRAVHSEVPIDEAAVQEASEPDAVTRIEKSACCRNLRRALRRLPPIYRSVLVDRFVRGKSIKAIAKGRRLPLGTVLSRLHAAKQRLRRAWRAVP